jgi:hypothetical protein
MRVGGVGGIGFELEIVWIEVLGGAGVEDREMEFVFSLRA